jgi:DNA repair exonuclease SbcCD ATPase subunit
MKIIHLADIHWRGLSRHDEYRESFLSFFEQARELNPDVIYIGGDIVHNKTQGISPELIDSLCWWFSSLSDIAPVHVILGNHDGLILNKDRQDAITPIIDALDDPNIFLYKDSGVYPVDNYEEFNWCVFSCFDEENWKNVVPEKESVNIALFHGAVWGSLTDIDWEIDGDVDTSFFDKFDFGLLGDIHKRQYLNNKKTLAYPGSAIQQNYGEDIGKGFLFWDIQDKDNFTSKFYEIPHFKPFITVDWKGTVKETLAAAENYPDEARFRIRSDNVLNHADSKRIQIELKKEKSASEVVFKSESSFNASKIQTKSGEFEKKNLRDPSTHKRLIRDYYAEESKIKESTFSQFDVLIDKYISQISDEEETLRNTQWSINSLKFDNLFAYGSKNVINFENIPGITGIFGKNTKGKSSIIGSLMYGLYNTTDRGSIKNEHIINSRKNNCLAEVDISINGEPYRILRSTQKHQTRKGTTYATTSLNLYRLDETGEVLDDLTEEQRRETEKVLRKVIGTSDDFLMTSLASQGEMNTFIREKATSRKTILSKFLDLIMFEKIHDRAKSDSSEIRNKMRSFPSIDWEQEIDDLKAILQESIDRKEEYSRDIKIKSETLQKLKIDLATSDNPDIITLADMNKKKSERELIEKNIAEISLREVQVKSDILDMEKKIEKIKSVKKDFSIDDLLKKREEIQTLEKEILGLRHENEKAQSELRRQEKSARKLKDVPCGDEYLSCKFIKDSHVDKGLILDQKSLVKISSSTLQKSQKVLDKILTEGIDEKIEKYQALSDMLSSLSIDVSSTRVRHNNVLNEKNGMSDILSRIQEEIADMESRYVKDGDNRSHKISVEILKIEKLLKSLDSKRVFEIEKIAKKTVEISKLETDKLTFYNLKDEIVMYDMFMQAVSRKGIPLQIMMSQLPLINAEISKILQGVTGFTVELQADLDSNSMDVFINYGDSIRIIELASGMEKMMASLAIRVALINVSTLTKTNILIIDEGFGALDETNIEACTRLLKSLKKWFRNILVISHVDSIKDAVDNSLEIVKKEKDANVYHP